MTTNPELGPIAGRYAKMEGDRRPFLDRAREMSELTIPSLFPPDGFSASTKLKVPYQNVGARGVNNISNKLHLTLLPPNSPFFRYALDPKVKNDIVAELGNDKKALLEIERGLAKAEKDVQSEIEAARFRPQLFEGIRQLVVGGNTLLYLPKGREARVFNLAQYVVARDGEGKVCEIIVHEKIARDVLPDEARTALAATATPTNDSKADEDIDVYTQVLRRDGRFYVRQELKNGIHIKSADGSYPNEMELPWFALRMVRVDGQDYGRSYVEEYQGDLQSLEGLQQSLIEGSAVMAKVLFLLDPNSVLKPKELANAENGDVVAGRREDVDVLQVEKHADFQVVETTSNKIEQRLEFAFLLNTAVQRDAERVTAEEIRYMAQELESALGGIYSLLSQEFQLKLVAIFTARMSAAGKIPKIKEKHVKPVITTGIEALGRGNDLAKIRAFVADVVQLATADASLAARIKKDGLLKRLAMGHGLTDVEDLIMDDDEFNKLMQQQQQATALQDMVGKTAPGVINTIVDKATNGQPANAAA